MLRSVSASCCSSVSRSSHRLTTSSRLTSTSSRSILITSSNSIRSISISSISKSSSTTTTHTSTTSTSSSSSSIPPTPSTISSTPPTPSTTPSITPTTSPYRSKPENIASLILRTSWLPLDSQRRSQLQEFITASESSSIDPPDFLFPLFETIRSYRAARSRLWVPHSSELFKANARFQSFLKDHSSCSSEDHNQSTKDLLSIGSINSLEGFNPEVERKSMSESEKVRYLSQLERESLEIMSKEERTEFKQLNQVEREDLIYRKVWALLTIKERENAMTRVSFECIRRLGWRKGFSSGYPLNGNDPKLSENDLKLLEERNQLLETLVPIQTSISDSEERTLKLLEAKKSLTQLEEKLAFEAWKKLSPSQKREEEKSTWSNRDRGRLYVSGGSLNPKSVQNNQLTTQVLGLNSPRWYSEPVRAGELIYLPNTIIRLVKNNTKPNEAYDPYKATFRIPYSMHKHALKNYLLSIYGLRITWIRTMIYRSSRARAAPGGSRDLRDRGFGRRNFKKAEVGLYEPFLFPEISESFKRQANGLLGDEMEVERMSGMIKLRGGKRWRSTRLPDVFEKEDTVEQMGSTVHQQLLPQQTEREVLEVKSRDGVEGNEEVNREVTKLGKKNRLSKRPKLLVRSGGIPTAKHSRILQMLGWKNEEREEKIREIIERQKGGK